MQSKSTFLKFFDGNSSLQIWPPWKILQGQILQVQITSLQSTMCFCLSHVFLVYRGGLFVCRVSWPVIRVWCASLLCGLLSSKLHCLCLKIELLAFWGLACLRRKKWPTWVRFGQLLARLIILKCKHKRSLFCRDARWRVFVSWLGQLFTMFTISESQLRNTLAFIC